MLTNCHIGKWAVRQILIISLVALADGLVVQFTRKPFLWAVLIPALIPVLTCFLVVLPMIKADNLARPNV